MGTTLKKGQSCHVSAKTQNPPSARPDFQHRGGKASVMGAHFSSMEWKCKFQVLTAEQILRREVLQVGNDRHE